METFQPRIIGTEMEWTLLVRDAENDLVPPDPNDLYSVFPALEPYGLVGRTSLFAGNGTGLWYIDHDHIESTTAEDTSCWGTVANEIVGGNMLYEALLKVYGDPKKFGLYRRVIGDPKDGVVPTTWGCHENYCINKETTRLTIDEYALAVVGMHLATRNVFCGSGAVLPNGDFSIGQKTPGINCSFHTDTVVAKPVLNLRDRPLADRMRYRRLHVTCGDPTPSPLQAFMKLATTSLSLRLSEVGLTPANVIGESYDFTPSDLRALAAHTANDLTLNKPHTLLRGKTIKPKEVQEALITATLDLSEKYELPREEQIALRWWQRIANEIDQGVVNTRYISWAAKKRFVERSLEKHRGETSDEQQATHIKQRADITFDRMPQTTLVKKLFPVPADSGLQDLDELVAHRTTEPPETRQKIRRAVIDAIKASGQFGMVTWNGVSIAGSPWKSINDPYATEDPAIEAELARLPRCA